MPIRHPSCSRRSRRCMAPGPGWPRWSMAAAECAPAATPPTWACAWTSSSLLAPSLAAGRPLQAEEPPERATCAPLVGPGWLTVVPVAVTGAPLRHGCWCAPPVAPDDEEIRLNTRDRHGSGRRRRAVRGQTAGTHRDAQAALPARQRGAGTSAHAGLGRDGAGPRAGTPGAGDRGRLRHRRRRPRRAGDRRLRGDHAVAGRRRAWQPPADCARSRSSWT